MPDPTLPPLNRRTVVVGAGVLGAGLVVAGCATEDPAADSVASAGGAAAGTTLGPAADVPVGGATIFAAAEVVVTQATAGSFAAFSTACPHQGCAVTRVEGTSIVCPCHGSTFGLDGSVERGPAQTGLEARTVTVANDQLTLG